MILQQAADQAEENKAIGNVRGCGCRDSGKNSKIFIN